LIEDASPSFYDIYDQALAAEQERFNHAAGPAYRKALEFLVKDYVGAVARDALKASEEAGDVAATSAATEELKAIRESQLGAVIEKRIDDPRIRETAKRAAWLGNDATHYIRKWESHDLQDLKDLIQLVVMFIESQESYNAMLERMPDPSKP
jgi:hypothetical protein